MTAISATSRTCKTMADGTLRLTVDIEPNSAQAAFQLFGMPDVPIALARLTQPAAKESAQAETIAEAKPKGGELAKWAGILCNDTMFWEWLSVYGDIVPGSEEDAAGCVRRWCRVESRSELDHDKRAGAVFRSKIMAPFSAWIESLREVAD